jgi:hypothetical protein
MMRIYQSVFDVMRPMPPFIHQLRDANRKEVKSQTRRVLSPQPISTTGFWKELHWANEDHFRKGAIEHCKYGKAGNILYMREPLFKGPFDFACYADSKTVVFDIVTGEPVKWKWKVDTLSQLYMPKIAARSFFQYEFVRVERVQEITRDSAKAEGMNKVWYWYEGRDLNYFKRGVLNPYIANFSVLWDEINGPRGYGWDVNPWVWVLGYKPFDMKEISVINSNMTEAEWKQMYQGEWEVGDGKE